MSPSSVFEDQLAPQGGVEWLNLPLVGHADDSYFGPGAQGQPSGVRAAGERCPVASTDVLAPVLSRTQGGCDSLNQTSVRCLCGADPPAR